MHYKKNFTIPLKTENLNMVWLEENSFVMGLKEYDLWNGECPEFNAKITKGFWLGQYLVTQGQWQAVTQYSKQSLNEKVNSESRKEWLTLLNDDETIVLDNINKPVANISAIHALFFCEVLNSFFENYLPIGYQFSLPTMMQWEYACRANTQKTFYSLQQIEEIAWYRGNSNNQTQNVGLKKPNAFNFYDMFGNVYQWCYDLLTDCPKKNSEVIDWLGPPYENMPAQRYLRGASYNAPYSEEDFDPGKSTSFFQETQRPWLGFRLALRWTKDDPY